MICPRSHHQKGGMYTQVYLISKPQAIKEPSAICLVIATLKILCASHWLKHFTYVNLFNPHNL